MTTFFIVILTIIIGCVAYKTLKIDKRSITTSNNSIKNSNHENLNTSNKIPMFIDTWTFEEFYKKIDKMQYGSPINSKTGETFKSCAFYKKGKPVVYVGFYNLPGELSLEELKKRTKELKVGLKESGRYLIYVGDTPYIAEPEPVFLGL